MNNTTGQQYGQQTVATLFVSSTKHEKGTMKQKHSHDLQRVLWNVGVD